MGCPLTLMSPRPCLAKATAVAVFFLKLKRTKAKVRIYSTNESRYNRFQTTTYNSPAACMLVFQRFLRPRIASTRAILAHGTERGIEQKISATALNCRPRFFPTATINSLSEHLYRVCRCHDCFVYDCSWKMELAASCLQDKSIGRMQQKRTLFLAVRTERAWLENSKRVR
jgi:hypothetical protein